MENKELQKFYIDIQEEINSSLISEEEGTNPEQIFTDMKQGIDFADHIVHEIHDRREAIKFAVAHAQAGDIVVIAGKGHENYQEIDGVRHWFDDVVEVQSALAAQSHSVDSAYPAQ